MKIVSIFKAAALQRTGDKILPEPMTPMLINAIWGHLAKKSLGERATSVFMP